jgi:glutamine amidotransferase
MAENARPWHDARWSMCRLFGFRSVIPSQVHRSLVAAENALGKQSNDHPDGWGVVYYVDGSPHITRSPETALGDALFHRLSGVVSSETVLAHVRRATQGPRTVLNCHPFQYGRWTFAHNGDIPRFESRREALLAEVSPRLRRFILGETDSEVVFFVFLSHLAAHGPLNRRFSVDDAAHALRATVDRRRHDGRHAWRPGALVVHVQEPLRRSGDLPEPDRRVRGAHEDRFRQSFDFFQ